VLPGGQHGGVGFTLVSFHAHPDDEALYTGGTLARAVAEGHRVLVVVATDGAAGLASRQAAGERLADVRLEELRRSARALGGVELRTLGYDDSGLDGLAGRDGSAFARSEVEPAAERLAEILIAESADVLTVYDPAGGYGHPDHAQVRKVGVRAAEIAATRVVLEATVDRDSLVSTTRILRSLRLVPAGWGPQVFESAYTPRALITHRVDVRDYYPQKRAAMAAHASQATADSGDRTIAAFLRLPGFVFRQVFGHEWFVEIGRRPSARKLDDVFSSLREFPTK
jgi:LmbE family N-acetylglucosaminyl deacetylase